MSFVPQVADAHQVYNGPTTQPLPGLDSENRRATIAELGERALTELHWDPSKPLKEWLRRAESLRKAGKECAEAGCLESAFVHYAGAATIVLEKIPTHKDYYNLLAGAQRHNLSLNGQDILDTLGQIKPTLINRYERRTPPYPDMPHTTFNLVPAPGSFDLPAHVSFQQPPVLIGPAEGDDYTQKHHDDVAQETAWKLREQRRREQEKVVEYDLIYNGSFSRLQMGDKSSCIQHLDGLQIYKALAVSVFVHLKFCTKNSAGDMSSFEKSIRAWKTWDSTTILVRHAELKNRLQGLLQGPTGLHSCGVEDVLDGTLLHAIDITDITNTMARALEDGKQSGFYLKRAEEARSLLNLLQALLDYAQLSPGLRRRFTAALIKLSTKSGCYPDCLVLDDIKKLGEDPIAAGSSGEVWKGSFRGQVIAMKILKVYERSDMDELLKRCSNEIIIWRQLSHPNLIPFYGVYHLNASKTRVCLISPWMEHGSITRFLKQYPNSNRTSLILDIARGLEYLHFRQPGIVHGDLKGENILITPSLRACLTDFGVASTRGTHILGPTTIPSMRVGGTLRWQAPELLDFETEDIRNSFASDVYAFGCVGYEIYTGEIPFNEMRSEYQVIQAVTKGVRPPRPSAAICNARRLDDDMWRFIERCWLTDPHARPTVSLLVTALCQRLRIDVNSKLATDDWDYSFMSKVSRTAEHPFSCSYLQ